jgi:hypothetical protein
MELELVEIWRAVKEREKEGHWRIVRLRKQH